MPPVIKDPAGTTYFAATVREFVGANSEWARRDFDVTLFASTEAGDAEIEAALDAVLARRPKWMFTTGPRSEYWHDVIDEKAVWLGIQKNVGDGEPMTAWFTEVADHRDWRPDHNLGLNEFHLFLFVGFDESLEESVVCLQRTIQRAIEERAPNS